MKNQTLVIIPVINECQNLLILLPKILNSYSYVDVLVIDDMSTDNTHLLINELQTQHHERLFWIQNVESLGIGGAHLQGLNYSQKYKYELAITMDGDLTHDPSDIHFLLQTINSHPDLDLVIGSRFLRNSGINGWSLLRVLLTHLGHYFTMLILQMTQDLSSGLRIYRVSEIPSRLLSIKTRVGYEYFPMSAFLYKSEAKRISEIGVVLNPRGKGNSKLTIKKVITSIFVTIRIRIFHK